MIRTGKTYLKIFGLCFFGVGIFSLFYPAHYQFTSLVKIQSLFRPIEDTRVDLITQLESDTFLSQAFANQGTEIDLWNYIFPSQIHLSPRGGHFLEISSNGFFKTQTKNTLQVVSFSLGGIRFIQSRGKVLQQKARIEQKISVLSSLLQLSSSDEKSEIKKAANLPQTSPLTGKLLEIQIKLAELESRYGEKHPEVIILQEELKNIQNLIHLSTPQNLTSSSPQPQKYGAQKEEGSGEIRRLLESLKNEKILLEGEEKIGQIRMELVRVPGKGKLLNRFFFNDFVQDRSFLILVLSLGLFIFSQMFNYMRELVFFSGWLKSPGQKISELLGAPLLINYSGEDGRVHPQEYAGNLFNTKSKNSTGKIKKHKPSTELLRTLIQFRASQLGARMLNFASPIHCPHSSALLVEVAQALADLRNRVLIVDFQMNNPTLHTYFDCDNHFGVSNLLAAPEKFRTVVCQDGSLFLLPTGPEMGDVEKSLNSKNFLALMEKIKQEADYILVLSPPLNQSSGGLLVSMACDSTILILEEDSFNMSILSRAKFHLESASIPLLGFVIL